MGRLAGSRASYHATAPRKARGPPTRASIRRNWTMQSLRSSTSLICIGIGRPWNISLVSRLLQHITTSGDELNQSLQGLLGGTVTMTAFQKAPGPKGSCKSFHSALLVVGRIIDPVSTSWNRGKGRIVYRRVMDRGMKVHRSVRTRIEASGKEGRKEYLPLIRCSINGTIRPLMREEWLAGDTEHFEWVD